MPQETFNYAAIAPAARDDVWATLQEPKTWEGIAGVENVHDPVIDAAGSLRGFSFESVVGGTAYQGRAAPGRREAGHTIAWDVETSEIAGSVTVKLIDEATGTRVDVTLDIESKGMLSGLFFPAISSAIGNGFPASVEAFATSLG